MADSKIEWCTKVWNVTRGCRRVSPGCGGPHNEGGCYAERQAMRMSNPGGAYEGLVELTPKGPRWTGKGRFAADKLSDPLKWRKPERVFVDSMSDLFFEEFTNEQIAAVFGVMAACPQHTFQVLTKRPKRMREWFKWVSGVASLECDPWTECHAEALHRDESGYIHSHSGGLKDRPWPLPNVWLGCSTEDQQRADERIPHLLETPAAVRFVSAEPLLGPIDFDLPRCESHDREYLDSNGTFCQECAADGWSGEMSYGHWLDPLNDGIDWVILGSESGPRARPMQIAWARNIVRQCTEASVGVFTKQIATPLDRKGGNPEHWPAGRWPREMPEAHP